MKFLIVYTGDIGVGSEPMEMESNGIGSCVVVILYDKVKRNGGMAHIMLPKKLGEHEEDIIIKKTKQDSSYLMARYAPSGIDSLLSELSELGSEKTDLVAALVGGANMFAELASGRASVGSRNVDSIESELEKHGIEIIKREVGGKVGRSVNFNLDEGKIEIVNNS
ncbi:hypothetical protein COB52_02105 [Candidatus Kaiserbacteria bacterium]|nr:MAG: hypothetical protein COB52_02105 [Candidatus Kaiserbacteria bacterium]